MYNLQLELNEAIHPVCNIMMHLVKVYFDVWMKKLLHFQMLVKGELAQSNELYVLKVSLTETYLQPFDNLSTLLKNALQTKPTTEKRSQKRSIENQERLPKIKANEMRTRILQKVSGLYYVFVYSELIIRRVTSIIIIFWSVTA